MMEYKGYYLKQRRMSKRKIGEIMADKKIILYGAGSNALCGIEHVKKLGYSPVCFVDSNIGKAGTFINGLPVKTFENINDEFNLSEALFYVTPNAPAKFEIMDFLIKKHKIAVGQIVNYERYTRKKICTIISNNQLTLETSNISLCCNIDDNVIQPVLNYDNLSPEEVYRKYYQMRNDAIDSIKNCGKLCSGCKDIIEGLFTEDMNDHIDVVAFGGGGRCNFRCIYCGFTQQDAHDKLSKDNCHSIIKKLCAIAGEFRKNGKIDKYTRVIIANGEPVLNPDLAEVLETFYDNRVSIYTNASIVSPIVCEKLRDGNSDLLISIDAGTAATFKYVKGVDCFNKVVENINVYAKYGEVNLKYILIPGVNIDHKNIEGFLSIAENIKANIVISKDLRGEDAFHENIDSIKAAAEKFVEGARIRGLGCTLLNFES